jgi:hypothetical protein
MKSDMWLKKIAPGKPKLNTRERRDLNVDDALC